MENNVTANKSILHYFDLKFFTRFFLLLLAFYFINLFMVQVAKPGGKYHNEFLYQNLHYGNWMRASILHTATVFSKALGMDTYLPTDKVIKVRDGKRSLLMARQCLGLEIMGFWAAFILAHSIGWRKKLLWTAAGLFAIWFINCWRVSILLFALEHNWKGINNIDHHSLFNMVAYALIGMMIYFFYKKSEKVNPKEAYS